MFSGASLMNVHKLPVRRLGILVLLALLLPASTQIATGQQGMTATLIPMQGLVQYRAVSAPENAWQTLPGPQIVGEGDWVRTDSLGEAQVAFFTGDLTTILANTQVQIGKLQGTDSSPVVSINQSVGDMQHQIGRVLDANSSYEVNTPSAVITVRGTNFWSSSTWLSETTVNTAEGITEIEGVSPDGVLSPPTFIAANQSLYVRPDGQPGQPGTFSQPPAPPSAPLAPATCGNGTCDAGENATNCALDCQTFPNCGNGICELDAGEGPVTCPADCVPAFRQISQQPTGPTTVTNPTAVPTSQPCTISTTRGDVEVRVGPGLNRGVRDYLVTNTPIPVIGQDTDSAGNLWWKIQPPGFNPAEADRYWVLSDNKITETGDCSAVPGAAPSQFIAPRPTAAPTSPPNATPIPGATLPAYSISFYADQYSIMLGECTTVHWSVDGINQVYYQGKGVVGHSSSMECPRMTTTYELRVLLLDSTTTYRYVTITVDQGYIG
jgi:hypothetical protein